MKRALLILFFSLTISAFAQNTPGKVGLFPNPAVSYVDVTLNETAQSDVVVTLSDILGNKIETYKFKSGETLRIEFAPLNLKNGMYLFKIESGDDVYLKRLVIKQ